MIQKLVLMIFCFLTNIIVFAQKNIEKQIDSLKYVTDMPRECNVSNFIKNKKENEAYIYPLDERCGDILFWNVVMLKEKAILPLIKKVGDATPTEATAAPTPRRYTVGDVALSALQEIIHGIPVYEIAGIKYDESLGSLNYWYYFDKKSNRKKFQKNLYKWYNENKNSLEWIESNNRFEICACFGGHPNGGYYEVEKNRK